MDFIINETGEKRELHYIDADTGVDCIRDIISVAIGDYITYDEEDDDEEDELYRISQADYDWWDEYITNAQEDAEELASLREEFDRFDSRDETGRTAIDDIILRYFAPLDMEDEHRKWQLVFEIIRETFGAEEN